MREALEGALIRRVAATIPEDDLAALDEVTRRMNERAKAGGVRRSGMAEHFRNLQARVVQPHST